jgi:hypothetical protein
MPTFNSFQFEQKPGSTETRPSAKGLAAVGPIIQVQAEIPAALARMLQAASQPIPKPVEGFALVDTGASITSIDAPLLAQLGVNPVGTVNVGTAGGRRRQSTYPVRLTFPGTAFPGFEHPAVLGVDLAGQLALPERPLIALIGRDILRRCVLVYNGTAGMFSLSL